MKDNNCEKEKVCTIYGSKNSKTCQPQVYKETLDKWKHIYELKYQTPT